MKKAFLTAAGLLALLQSFGQPKPDSTGFAIRKLKVEEVDFVSSYYHQNGNNSSVTGGIGTEKLTDVANIIDVKVIVYDRKTRKHTFDIEMGFDHYTSASSDMIDLKANSSSSHQDGRFYPSLTWGIENEKKGATVGIGSSFSLESDYQSIGANVFFTKKTKDKNGELSAKLQAYFDQVWLVLPEELRMNDDHNSREFPHTARNTFSGSLSYSQVVNERLQVMFLADAVQQTGYLSLPFHRVYFADSSVHQEHLPDSRFKLPLGVRASYFVGDRIILKGYYRFYTDDWGLTSHTAHIEVPIKITPFISVSPFYRYYSQTAIQYFAPYKTHTILNKFYTSNYDLSNFHSHFLGAGLRLAPPKGVFGNKHLTMAEIRYGHYAKNIGLQSNIVSLHLKFK